jgi:hypothetical protein
MMNIKADLPDVQLGEKIPHSFLMERINNEKKQTDSRIIMHNMRLPMDSAYNIT